MLPLHLPAVSTDLQYGLYELDACPAAEALNPALEHAAAVVAEDEETDGNDASFA